MRDFLLKAAEFRKMPGGNGGNGEKNGIIRTFSKKNARRYTYRRCLEWNMPLQQIDCLVDQEASRTSID